MRTFLSRLVSLLIAALLVVVLSEPSAWAGPEAAHAASGTITLTRAAAWGLGLLLAGGLAGAVTLAGAARRHAAGAAACNADLAAANGALQDEIAHRARLDDERTAQQREMEESAQSLTQTNALLEEASGRFQELFQGLPVACVCCDREGRVMEWNRAWTRLHALANPLGRTVGDLIGGLEGAPALAEAMAAARVGEAREGVAWTVVVSN